MRAAVTVLGLFVLGGCVPMGPVATGPVITPAPAAEPFRPDVERAAYTFVSVVERVEPVAEDICRQRTRGVRCDFQIAIDDRPGQSPNAFQTLSPDGQPILAFNLALILDARNADELAFVMGHEAAHHIAGHMSRQQQTAVAGAIVAGTLASLGGAGAEEVRAAQDMGAQMGARTFSKDFELEADALGTEIAWAAGYDPRLGAQFFFRLPDPGNRFLGSHPPNAQRLQVVEQTMQSLR
jgi:predicted Zn-dependent protease